MLKKLINSYDKTEEVILVISLAVTVCLIFAQILMRWLFNNSITWSEELARYIFIWQIWLGTSIGFKGDKHIKITIIRDLFKEKGRAVYDIIARCILLVFCAVMVVMGMKMVAQLEHTHYLSAALRMPLSWVYMALPFSSLIVCLRIIGKMIYDFKILFNVNKALPQDASDHIGGGF